MLHTRRKRGNLQKGINFSLYEGTEPIFIEKPNGIVLAENKFLLNLGKSE